ncbi:MAG: cellulose biosynthesis protein BcsG [Azovibrio sp.]|uniref:cellulose biosynthesis protein BcsG n=1 Tax=Azovibrio sp. TaxID=1872673 RepID=UPI003C78A6A7
MGLWSLYFLAKLALFHGGYSGFHVWENLLFAVAMAWPQERVLWRRLRHLAAVPVALALLYHDSWLPPLNRLLSQAGALRDFSLDYLLELLGRFINPSLITNLLVALVLVWFLGRILRLATFVFLGILSVVPMTYLPSGGLAPALTAQGKGGQGSTRLDPDARLAAFYQTQKRRQLPFHAPESGPPAFDVIYLHICSLSWDDMAFLRLQEHPFFQNFDFLFRQFNSAASYSGPAAVRLLKSSCGQHDHKETYRERNPQCQLFRHFEEAGFEAQALLNHDGRFDNFGKLLESEGGFSRKPMIPQDAPVAMRSFDNTPIYSDLAVLSRWWQARQQTGGKPVALYYNSISLHDGNRLPGEKSTASLQTYKPRLTQLLEDFDRFIKALEASNRPVVVVLLGEHGAALRGDRLQIAGLREIPSPRITLVPAAVKLIGMPGMSGAPQVIDRPTSYLALTAVLAQLLNGETDREQLAARLPETEHVSETDALVLMRLGEGYKMRSADGVWVDYRE